MKRFLPWLVLVFACRAGIAASWLPPKVRQGRFRSQQFRQNSGARRRAGEAARHGRAQFAPDHSRQTGTLRLADGKRLSAMQWLTDVLFNAPVADQYPVFVIQNAEVLGLFGWEQSDRKYFSFAELSPFLRQIDEQGAQSEKLESVERSAYQSAILNLRNALVLYQRLKNSLQPEGAENFAANLQRFASAIPAAAKAARQREAGEKFRQGETRRRRGADSALSRDCGDGLHPRRSRRPAGPNAMAMALGRRQFAATLSAR